MEPLSESSAWLDHLNDDVPFVHLEKDALQVNEICQRGRDLVRTLNDHIAATDHILQTIQGMLRLDAEVVGWRQNPKWSSKTLRRDELSGDTSFIVQIPPMIQLHPDIWMAYEWDYHRTARMLLHEQLLNCVDSFLASGSGDAATSEQLLALANNFYICDTAAGR